MASRFNLAIKPGYSLVKTFRHLYKTRALRDFTGWTFTLTVYGANDAVLLTDTATKDAAGTYLTITNPGDVGLNVPPSTTSGLTAPVRWTLDASIDTGEPEPRILTLVYGKAFVLAVV